jgi:branched-subunit amino acid transport protein AzlD
MSSKIVIVAISLCLLSVITRALPFWFARFFKDNETLTHVGKALPAYVMMLLVVYEVKLDTLVIYPYALPSLLALLLVVIMQYWFRQVLLSMLVGTVSYMVLYHLTLMRPAVF